MHTPSPQEKAKKLTSETEDCIHDNFPLVGLWMGNTSDPLFDYVFQVLWVAVFTMHQVNSCTNF